MIEIVIQCINTDRIVIQCTNTDKNSHTMY